MVRLMLHGIALNFLESVHTVNSSLALGNLIGIAPRAEVIPPEIGNDSVRRAQFAAHFNVSPAIFPDQPLVVLHPYPMFAYKRWHIEGWAELIRWVTRAWFRSRIERRTGRRGA
jgi:heptosyltransferase-3